MSTRHVERLEKRKKWLPDMDLNHDKQIQSLLCYRYTIGQERAHKIKAPRWESRLLTGVDYSQDCIKLPVWHNSSRGGDVSSPVVVARRMGTRRPHPYDSNSTTLAFFALELKPCPRNIDSF